MPQSEKPKRFPGEVDEAYPEIFTTKPPQPSEKKPGQLPQHMIDQFFNDGYVIVEKFFDCEKDLEPCKKAIELEVDILANKLFKGGKIKQLYNEYGLRDRLTYIEKEFPGANMLLHKTVKLAQAFKDLWTNERLLNVVEQLIGPEISGNPIWNLRTKTPNNEATTVPWHQDAAYLDNRAYKILQPTAWIPLLDTNEKNGCMRVVSGAHRKGKIALHQCCWKDTTYIMLDEQEMTKTLGVDMEKDVVPCPVPYGGMLLINNVIPHQSLPNLSDEIRWSLDLRWQKTGLPASFYDMAETVEFRSPTKHNLKIDWSPYDVDANRHVVAAKELTEFQQDEFDTTIQGPWMRKWEMVHTNANTDGLKDDHVFGISH
ncbi:uncharacterized protein LOC126820550 [Patella vulgata]|uniref:uncharacterized protein LOC126820550 n=1 Tax=Patella vulgata TaxID=6465 RepID=UPI0021805FF5|nr:uncharacterized protein LOC126820550 [Patella vulgata]XP_050404533.1 uncharacterized protein LOC126820550 [Patella vulgata]